METGGRYDVIFDFDCAGIFDGDRVIIKNLGGDSPFGGDIPGERDIDEFPMTDRIMAFDVVKPFDRSRDDPPVKYSDFSQENKPKFGPDEYKDTDVNRIRAVGLFEGT